MQAQAWSSVAKAQFLTYDFRMKAAVAFGLLCAIPAWAQTISPKIQVESRVPSVTIRLVGEQGGSYKFFIENASAHNVTAFDVLLVPSGVQKKGHRFLCQSRCLESQEIQNIDKPAIKAGGTAVVTYEMATVKGGAVVLEAAIFDDATYAGSERAAAFLVADQLGNQTEFDRIVSAVDNILASTGPQNAGKATQIVSALARLPVDADSATMVDFYRWFPNLRDCGGQFPQIMKGASAKEEGNVQERLQQFLLGGEPSNTALAQWWSATEQYLARFGCNECTAKMASPSPPVTQRTVSIGCTSQLPAAGGTVLSVEIAEDSETDVDGTDDTADQTPESDADPSDMTSQDANNQDANNSNNDELSTTGEPVDPATPVAATTPATDPVPAMGTRRSSIEDADFSRTATSSPPSMTSRSIPTPARRIPIMPRLIQFPLLPRGVIAGSEIATGSEREALRLVTDEQLYSQYFRYVVAWENYLSDVGTPTSVQATGSLSPDPYPAKMSESKRVIVAMAAYDWRDKEQQSPTKAELPDTSIRVGRMVPYRMLGPPLSQMQRMRQRADERAAIVKSQIENLRLRLGKNSFDRLDGYVHGLYHASAGKLVVEPLPETAMCTRYLRYIASLDKYAASGGEDGQRRMTAELCSA